MTAVDMTSQRAGLIICGDLQTAAAMVSKEPATVGGGMNAQDKVRELILYYMSEEYFGVRREIGTLVA